MINTLKQLAVVTLSCGVAALGMEPHAAQARRVVRHTRHAHSRILRHSPPSRTSPSRGPSAPASRTSVTPSHSPAPAAHPAITRPAPPTLAPTWPAYDEIELVAQDHLMQTGDSFDPAGALTAGTFVDSLDRLRKVYLHHGITDLPPLPTVDSPTQALTRQQAVDLLVKALLPATAQPAWSPQQLLTAVLDLPLVQQPYQKSAALAAEHLFLPNPLRPTDPADRAFGADLIARALPWENEVPTKSIFADEIRKALSMHLFYSDGAFPAADTITTGELARAIQRARMYVPSESWVDLPDLPVASTDKHPLTRAQAVAMISAGLVDDTHLNTQLAASGRKVADPDTVVVYALQPTTYLSGMDDASDMPDAYRGPFSVAVYKGWVPNISSPTESGKFRPNSLATKGYVADVLARAVNRPGDYTGIILDMSGLKPLDRAGGMWVLNAGASTTQETPPVQVYPSSAHLPVRPFYSAPGALGYYGTVNEAMQGRAGAFPLVIKPLDWAQYDWTTLHGEPGLRRGGGTAVPLTSFHFVHGTPPLILVSPEDAQKMQQLDQNSLLLRKARVALVQPNWDLMAMRPAQ